MSAFVRRARRRSQCLAAVFHEMKRDIASREDIDVLVIRFYGRAMSDPVIGYLFTEVAQLDLEHHLPVIGDF